MFRTISIAFAALVWMTLIATIKADGEQLHQLETIVDNNENSASQGSAQTTEFAQLVVTPVTAPDADSSAVNETDMGDEDTTTFVHVRIRITYTPSFAASPIVYVLCILILISIYRINKNATPEEKEVSYPEPVESV